DTQIYGAILPQHLTNQAMLDYEAYKTYHAYATGLKTPKPKYVKEKTDLESSPKKNYTQVSKGKRIKSSAKVAKSAKKKQPATTSKDKRAGDKSMVPNVPKYTLESEEESWTFSHGNDDSDDVEEESNANDDSEATESDDDGDDFVHPSLSTYIANDQEEEEKEEEEKRADDEEEFSNQSVHMPLDYQPTNDEASKEGDDKAEEGEEEKQEDEVLYRDLNLNLQRMQQQSSSISLDLVSKFINPSLDTCIDSILNQNTQPDTLADVPVCIAIETPSITTTTLKPPTPNIHSLQQTPDSTTTTTNPTTTLPEFSNFASLFGFDQRVSALESKLSMLKQ
ncbi:hypothetical protein Tco_0732103, partial [Tanacetum coccineum]